MVTGVPSQSMASRFLGEVNAPDFKPSLAWLNVERPLRLEDFRGRLLILDFWTYC